MREEYVAKALVTVCRKQARFIHAIGRHVARREVSQVQRRNPLRYNVAGVSRGTARNASTAGTPA